MKPIACANTLQVATINAQEQAKSLLTLQTLPVLALNHHAGGLAVSIKKTANKAKPA